MAETTDITMSIGLDITDATKSAKALRNIYSSTFNAIQKQALSQLGGIGRIQDSLFKLYDIQQKTGSTPLLDKQIQNMENQFKLAVENMGQTLSQMSFGESAVFEPIIRQLIDWNLVSDETRNKLRDMMGEISNSERTAQTFANMWELIGNTLRNTGHIISSVAVTGLRLLIEALKNLISVLGNAIKKLAQFVGATAIKGIKSLGNLIKSKLNPSIKNTGKGLGNATGLLKKFILAGIGVRSIYFLFRKFWNMVKDGVNIMAQTDDATNKALSSIKTASYSLQKQLGSLFSTLVQAVAPAITAIINLLTKAVTLVTQFFAALGGKSTYKKATTQTQDYAKSLSSASKATKKAKDENKKYMSGLDEIATWEDKNKDNDTGGGGADLAGAYETAPIESKFTDLAKKLKDLWNKGEFYQLGYELAEAMANGLDKIYDLIQWDNVKDKITYYCNAFTGIINGIIGNKHFWDSLGAVIGAGINTIVQTLYLLITGIDWTELGRSLATSVNRIVEEIDWETFGKLVAERFLLFPKIVVGFIQELDVKEVGDAVSDFFVNAFDTASEWVESVDWEELGQQIADLIASIDWGGIAESMFELLGASLGGLAAFIWGLIEDAWNDVVEWWNEVAFEDGEFTFQGLLDGIIEAAKDIGTWIKEHIFEPFIEGFKKAFGIASPSKVMSEMGDFIMQGLIEGIEALIGDFSDIWEELKEIVISIFEGMWEGIKSIINSILGGVEKMVNGIISGLNKAIDAINNLHFDIPDWVPLVGGKSLKFSIPTLTEVSIPRLAQGAVIPANSPFLAMLGDQKQGTNIEAPLETIKQAVAEVVGSNNNRGGNYEFIAQINRRTLFDEMITEAKLRQSASGRNPFEFA